MAQCRKADRKKRISGPDWIEKKAELVVEGQVHVPKGTALPVFPIKSSGGPTSSRPHIILAFGPKMTRVKVAISDSASLFELRKGKGRDDVFTLVKNGRPFLGKVSVIPAVMHAPDQAFINIDATCDRGCLFCSAETERDLGWSAQRWIKVILDRYKKAPFGSVAITSGVPHGEKAMVQLMVDVVSGVREALPRIPIGVEPNAVSLVSLEMLRAAGADELKVNIQTATEKVFRTVCPKLDRRRIMDCLRDAVDVFGPGNVCSNIIIGLGETDKEVLKCVEQLAALGVLANIRAIRVNEVNHRKLEKALGKKVGIKDPRRLTCLAIAQRAIFTKFGLAPEAFRTMCHRCACCDLTVGVDL